MDQWRVVPEPYADETLTSWLMRIALENYTNMTSLLSQGPYKRGYARYDFDVFKFEPKFYQWLSRKTGVSKERINNMTYHSLEGYIEETVSPMIGEQWIVMLGGSTKNGYRICPKCFAEASYYRKDWRILFINICEKHNVYLVNKCPRCEASISPKFLNELQSVHQCHSCSFDLRKSSSINAAESTYLIIQKKLEKIAGDGFYYALGRWHYSVGYFDILHYLVLYVLRHRLVDGLNNSSRPYLYKVEPVIASKAIAKAYLLLENWPNVFREFCKEHKISNHFRLFDKAKWETLPFWFVSEMKLIFEKYCK